MTPTKGIRCRGEALFRFESPERGRRSLRWPQQLDCSAWDVNGLACPCGGRLKMLEIVTEPDEIRAIAGRLSLDDESARDA